MPMKKRWEAPLLIAVAAGALAGCATTDGAAHRSETGRRNIVLNSTDGDLTKYVGTWTSACGREFRLTEEGRSAFSSGTNTFRFTAVSSGAIEGILTVDTYASRDCSGSATQRSERIIMKYQGSIPVFGLPGVPGDGAANFSGSADRLSATVAGGNGNDNLLNVGFMDNFGKFQLSPVDYFSPGNLVYTKK